MDDSEKFLLWLRLVRVSGLGRVRIKRLFQHFQDIEKIFSCTEAEFKRITGASRGTFKELWAKEHIDFAQKELDKCDQLGVKLITLDSPQYPENLFQIPNPPPILYLKGRLEEKDQQAVAVVGSRNHNEYGEIMAKKLGSGLARYGITVVSGLARGIDSLSQASALEAGGRSIAVLGSGIDVIYPPEMASLYQRIVEQGAVLSEFPLGTPPNRENFPERNRVISGLSLGVVVVQASNPKSGSLITARWALEQGRVVFAVPGNAGTVWAKATNQLIRQGAILVEDARDIVEDLFPQLAISEDKTAPLFSSPLRPELTEVQQRIYSLIPEPEEGSVELDRLIRQSGLDSSQVQSALIELELEGLIEKLAGGKWRKKLIPM